MPKVIAARSITKLPMSDCERRTNARPDRMERSTGSRCSTVAGGCGDMACAAAHMPRHVTASTRRPTASPNPAISRPPAAGPTTIVTCARPKLIDSAPRSSRGGTGRGTIAPRVTRSTVEAPAVAAASRNSSQTGGSPWTAAAVSPAARAPGRSGSSSSSRRRSKRSAIAPASSDAAPPGPAPPGPPGRSWNADPVSSYTWNGSATSAAWLPSPVTSCAEHEQAEVAGLPQRADVRRDG